MARLLLLSVVCLAGFAAVREHPGGGELPHDKYIRVVREKDSPVERVYVKAKDGLYVAAALRKPKGPGPFPVLIHFHGAPGGRGVEKLVDWSSGSTGGPVWERFLQEGFVVVVSDYRRVPGPNGIVEPSGIPNLSGFVDDGMAVVDYVRALPYVDAGRINLYGVSLGGDLVASLSARTKVHAAILGAPAPFNFLGAMLPPPGDRDRLKPPQANPEVADKNVAAVQCPVLIFAGTADSLLPMDRDLHDRLAAAGKQVWMEVYQDGYHDFVMGPQGHPGRKEPLMGATLDALDRALQFARNPSEYH